MTLTAEAPTENTLSLLAIDRCDRCGSQALSKAAKDGAELLFCLHHAKEHYDALREQGWTITSDVEKIEQLFGNVPELEEVP